MLHSPEVEQNWILLVLGSSRFKSSSKNYKDFISEMNRDLFFRRGYRGPVPGSKMMPSAKMAAGSGFTRPAGRERAGWSLRRMRMNFAVYCCSPGFTNPSESLKTGTKLLPVKGTGLCFYALPGPLAVSRSQLKDGAHCQDGGRKWHHPPYRKGEGVRADEAERVWILLWFFLLPDASKVLQKGSTMGKNFSL